MAYGEQKIKLPPGASLIEEDEVKLPEGATLISDDASKKKASTVSFGETYSSPELDSETPSTGKIPQVVDMGDGELLPDNPILLSRKYNELKGRKKTIPQVGGGSAFAMGTGSIEIPDEDAVNLSKKIKEYLGDIDPDQISSEFKGVRDEDINIHGEELLADRKQNPQLYQRKLGRLKWERGLNEELLKSVESGRLNNDDYNNISESIKSSLENSSVGDYKQQRENVNSVANAIKQFGGENKEQLLKEYATEVSKVYGNSYNFGFGKTKEETPEGKYLTTPEAQLGYDYIKDLSPEKAEQYKRLFVDAKSLKDKPEEQKGYNHLMQTLEETGIGLMENSVNEELNNLKTIAEKTGGLTPEQIEKATKLEEKLSELNQKKTELDSKYPDRINDKVDDAIQEILGQNLSWGSYAAGSAGKAFKNTAQGIWEAVSTPFMSDESNRLRELYIMGESLDENQVYRKTDANKALVTDTLVIKPELQSQIDAIKNDKTLSREQKEFKLYPLLKNNSDKFGRVPIQGGKFNVNPSSILYGVTDLGTTLLPFIALEAATGGIGGAGAAAKFLRTFTAAAATSFHDEYANAILKGKSESDAYKEAMGLTAINSFAMAGAGTPEAVRSMAGLKTSAGQIISRMSDAEIKKVLERGTKSKALNALKDRISATPEMIKKGAESGAKFEVAMNTAQEAKKQLYNTEIDREEQFKHNLLNIANFSLLGGVLGHVGYKSPSNLQKSGLIEFGKNPDGFLASIEQMKKEGSLSQADFDQRKGIIEKSAEAYKSLPELNDKGKPLSATEQGEILYNTVIKNESKKAASTLPPQQAEKAEMKSMVADYANGIILENPTDKQLESRKNTLEKQIEGKDENGKPLLPEKELLKAKAQLEAVNNAIQRKENNVEVQAPINTGESIPLKTEEQSRNENGIVVEKPMVVPEPITISSEPTKTQPTNEAKANEVQQQAEVKEPTITEPNKVGEEAETATEEQVKKLITDAAINKKGERAKQLAMEEEAAKHGELGQKVLGDMNGGKEPPVEPKEVANDGSEDWAAVRKEKLKEINGVKEMMEKRKPKGWTQTFQSAAENVQKMFPKKSLYEAMKARVKQLKLKLESGELYNPTSEDNAVFTMLRAETNKRISEVEGQDSSNPVERLAANIELENLHNDLMDIARVTNPEGEAGRAFNILQSEAKFDENNGLKIRRMELMKAKGGEPLTPEENKWAESQWEKEKEIMRQEQEAKVKGMQEDFDNKISELQKEYEDKLKKAGNTPKGRATKESTLNQKGDKSLADKIRKLKMTGTRVDFTLGGWNVFVEGVAKIVEAGKSIKDAIQQLIDEKKVGFKTDKDRADAESLLAEKLTKPTPEETLEKIKEFAKENDVTDITNDMVGNNLIRDYVNSHIGEVEQKDLLDEAYSELKKELPSITKPRLIEAYLKENEFKQPTKKDIEGGLSEAKKQLKSIAKATEDIEDLEGLKKIRQRVFPNERARSEYEQKLYDEKNAKLKEISDRNNKIKTDNARIEAERNRQLKKVDELRAKKTKLEQGIIEKTEARDRKLDTPEIEKLRNEVKQIEKDIRAAEAAQKAAERKIISNRNKSIKEGNRKVESEAIRQVSKVQELQAKKEALENGIREKRDVIKKVDTPEIEAMKKAVKEADDNLRAAEVEARRMAKEIQDKKDKIGELDANIERAKNDRDLIKTHKDKSVREIDEEISNKQKELKKAIKDNSSDERVQAKKLEDAKKNVIKQKDEFQRKLDEGEFEEPEPIKLKKKDAELIRLEKEKSIIEEAYRKKQKEFQEKNKHWAERAMDTIRSSYVALLIGSPVTLAKVGFMSLVRPLSEGIRKATLGKVFDSFFPNISKAALRGGESSSISSIKKGYEAYFRNIGEAKLEEKYQKAENELRVAAKEYNDYKNSSNPDAKKLEQLKNKMNDKLIKSTGSFIYKFIGSSSIKDAWTALVNRSNEIEKQFGKVESESFKDGNWLDKSNYVAGFIGRSHSAAKTFSGRFSFAAGFMARLEGAVKNGEDITKGDKILEIAHESYLDWERGKYQQSNAISDIWNKITNSISKGEEKGIRTTTAKAMEALLKGDVAITRVPVNILHESVVEYTFGAIKAAYMGGKEYLKARKDVKESGIMPNEVEFKDALRQRISQMDEKQAATIVRCFTKGGLGIGLYALALISGGVQFGILPHLGQKKKKDEKDLKKGEMNPGDIIIGDTRMNHTFAKLVEHVPALYPTAMGLGMAQAYKDEIDKGKTTKEAVAKSLFTHLQIIEGSVPQTQILSPSRVSKKMYDIGEKRLEEMGVVNTDEKSIFTKDEQENATIKTLKERGIELKQPSQSHHKIDVDEKHPNGLMMPDEWEKFQKIRKDVILKGIPKSKDQDAIEGLDDIMKAHYKVVEKSKWGRVKSKIVQGKDLTDEQLKSKVQSLQEKATEYANDKLGLKKKKDTTTTIKKIR